MGRLAIIAGQGVLPLRIAAADPDALFVDLGGSRPGAPANETLPARVERLGAMFDAMRGAGVEEAVLAGGIARPDLDRSAFDAATAELAPRILSAMRGGDDGLLREVVAIFEERGFAVRGAHELLPDLVAGPGRLAGPEPSEADRADIARARAILAALGPLDVGQGAVVAGGQALGIETAQGTDAMLRCVAGTPPALRRGARGVLVKAPKPGQDLRIDMPAIGPATVAAAAEAGLAGLALAAGAVLLIERGETLAAAEAAGLFVLAEAP